MIRVSDLNGFSYIFKLAAWLIPYEGVVFHREIDAALNTASREAKH